MRIRVSLDFDILIDMDETWVNQNHSADYMWLPNDGSDAPKNTIV
jgi:hypothetical protein